MKYYETILIFNGKYTETRYKSMTDSYIKTLTDLGGLIRKTDRLGKKKLAYEIRGTKEGWYAILYYQAYPELIPELEKVLRTDTAVIKFLTIRRDPEEDELEEDINITPDDHPEETKSEQKSPGEIDYFNLIYNIS